VGPRAILHAVVKRKITSPRRESNPRTPIVQSSQAEELIIQSRTHQNESLFKNIIIVIINCPYDNNK
jgi:hypothetical protein